MSFSYSGIVGYGKSSLPSVENWGTNNNILRDPPRSITTRRIDKVGDNSFISQQVEESGDRFAEAIMAYPRGVNPMVGVSYNGAGNAGIGGINRGQQAKLPYRVNVQGAFRAPILAPVDLLPLSRMPRRVMQVNSQIFAPDYTKRVSCAPVKQTVKLNTLKVKCPSTLYFKIDKPSEKGTRENIKVPLVMSACASNKFIAGKEQREMYTKPNISSRVITSAPSTKYFKVEKAVQKNVGENIKKSVNISARAPTKFISGKEQRSLPTGENIKVPLKISARAPERFIAGKEQRSLNTLAHVRTQPVARALNVQSSKSIINYSGRSEIVPEGHTVLNPIQTSATAVQKGPRSYQQHTNLEHLMADKPVISVTTISSRSGDYSKPEFIEGRSREKKIMSVNTAENFGILSSGRSDAFYSQDRKYRHARKTGGVLVPNGGMYNPTATKKG